MDAVSENRIKEAVLPMERAVESAGKIIISDTSISNICNGSPLYTGGIVRLEDTIKKGDWVAIFSLKGELVAIGKAFANAKEMMKGRGTAAKIDRVLMKKETYPKF